MQYICTIVCSKTPQYNMAHLLNTLQYFAQYTAVKLLGVLWRNCLIHCITPAQYTEIKRLCIQL
jgi:hypothetical protein